MRAKLSWAPASTRAERKSGPGRKRLGRGIEPAAQTEPAGGGGRCRVGHENPVGGHMKHGRCDLAKQRWLGRVRSQQQQRLGPQLLDRQRFLAGSGQRPDAPELQATIALGGAASAGGACHKRASGRRIGDDNDASRIAYAAVAADQITAGPLG